MNRPFPNSSFRNAAGFTILELVVVLAIITILAGIVIGVSSAVQSKARRDRAAAEIRTISSRLGAFKDDTGDYPAGSYLTSNRLFVVLCTTVSNSRALMPPQGKMIRDGSASFYDPYGYRYGYNAPGSNNVAGFDLWSTAGGGDADSSAMSARYPGTVTNSTSTATWINNWKE